MDIVPLTLNMYNLWDDFCAESSDAWFWHTSRWLEYILCYKPEFQSKSLSFMILSNNRVIAVCPLVKELRGTVYEFSFGGYYCPIPALVNFLSPEERSRAEKLVFDHIDKLALDNNIVRSCFRFAPIFMERHKDYDFNSLARFGYVDIPTYTQVISILEDRLWNGVSKGHKYEINKGRKYCTVTIYTKDNITRSKFREYEELHHKAARRVTRPQVTFEMMFNYIKSNLGILAETRNEDKAVGFAYIYTFKEGAYYGSGCRDKGDSIYSSGHFLHWEIIRWLKENNYKYYEVGLQNDMNMLVNIPGKEEIGISKFKRGFGGTTVPAFLAEKYYTKDYFLKVYHERINRFADSISGQSVRF